MEDEKTKLEREQSEKEAIRIQQILDYERKEEERKEQIAQMNRELEEMKNKILREFK